MIDSNYYSQKTFRETRFIIPPNILKSKVGAGGLDEKTLEKAQNILEQNNRNFRPLAGMYLSSLQNAAERAKGIIIYNGNTDELVKSILHPSLQLKASGSMFHYPLITKVADQLIIFLERIKKLDDEALEIVFAFHTSMNAIVTEEIKGDSGNYGQDLMRALKEACYRYFEKHPYNKIRTI